MCAKVFYSHLVKKLVDYFVVSGYTVYTVRDKEQQMSQQILSDATATAVMFAGEVAENSAKQAVQELYNQYGTDQIGACGFGFVTIYGVRANSKVGKALKAIGFRKQEWNRAFQLWNPGNYGGQNVDIKEAGARAYAAKFKEITGIEIYPGSRLD